MTQRDSTALKSSIACLCPCHSKGDPGQGYVYGYVDGRDIWHEDWIDCRCESEDAAACKKGRL